MKLITITVLLISLFATTEAFTAKIQESQQAPNIQRTTALGNDIDLQQYKGQTVLLTFFCFAGCPICNYRMHELMEHYEELKAQNIEVIAVFESSNETLSAYAKSYEVPFPLIGDPERSLFKAYGVERSTRGIFRTLSNKEAKEHMKQGEALFTKGTYKKDGSMKQMQADFIINAQGQIAKAHYATYIGDHIPLQEVQQAGESSEQTSIEAVIKAFASAGDHQDADALEKVLDVNYRIVMNQLFGSSQVIVMSREAYLAKIKTKEFGGDQRQISIESLSINGNTASAKVHMEGSKMTFVSLLSLVKNAQGEWKLVQDLPTILK